MIDVNVNKGSVSRIQTTNPGFAESRIVDLPCREQLSQRAGCLVRNFAALADNSYGYAALTLAPQK